MKRMLVGSMGMLALSLMVLANSQQSSPGRPLPDLVGKVIAVRQGSRPAEKFVTLRAWERPDKTIIRYVRSEETGELATLVETPTQALLYRWGLGRTEPPPGVPTIPESASSAPQRLPEAITSSPGASTDKPATQQAAASQQSPAPQKPATVASVSAPAAMGSPGGWVPSTSPTARPPQTSTPRQLPATDPTIPTVTGGSPIIPGTQAPANLTDRATADGSATSSPRTRTSVTAPASTTSSSATVYAQPDPVLLRQLNELDQAGGVITLHFADRGVQNCVILQKTIAADGTVTLTVRSQVTGEVMTVTTGSVHAPTATLLPSPTQAPPTSVFVAWPTSGTSVNAPATSSSGLVVADPMVHESFWSRLRRRLGLGQNETSPMPDTGLANGGVPTPVLAPPPREVGRAMSDGTPATETRVIVGPASPPPSTNQTAATPTQAPSGQPGASGTETRVIVGPVSTPPSTNQTAATPTQAPSGQPEASFPKAPESVKPALSEVGSPNQQSKTASTSPERRGLFNRIFRRDSVTSANGSSPSRAERVALTPEQQARLQSQFAQMLHLAAFLPPQKVVSGAAEPPVPFPPPLTAKANPSLPNKPDPLREPDKYVKRNPVRQEVTNAGLLAEKSKPAEKSNTQPTATSPEQRPANSVTPKPNTPATPAATVQAPVPLPLVPLVTDKPRPDAPPPQPPIQPFNTLQVAAVQNPYQFPSIAPPAVPSQPAQPATPVSWTRGPLLPPQQSPVSTLAFQSQQSGTEALALRNTLFLTNVLQASGSPQQREWAAARLAVIEPNRYPFAVEALVQAARHDPHPAVRIKAIQSLALMRADSPAVRQTLQLAQNDPDPRIREQAAAALQLLGTASPAEVVPAQFVPSPR